MVLGIYPADLKTYVNIKASTRMLMAPLFTITKNWKQLRCPSTGEWINKWWYIHTMEFYPDIKKNELSNLAKDTYVS